MTRITQSLTTSFDNMKATDTEEIPEHFLDTIYTQFDIFNKYIEAYQWTYFQEILKLAYQNPDGTFDNFKGDLSTPESALNFSIRLSEVFGIQEFYLQIKRDGSVVALPTNWSSANTKDYPIKLRQAGPAEYQMHIRENDGWSHFMDHHFSAEPENEDQEQILQKIKIVFSDDEGSFFEEKLAQLHWDSLYDEMIFAEEIDEIYGTQESQMEDVNTFESEYISAVQEILDELKPGTDPTDRMHDILYAYVNHTVDALIFFVGDCPERKFIKQIDSTHNKIFDEFKERNSDQIEELEGSGYRHFLTATKEYTASFIYNHLKNAIAITIGWPLISRIEYFTELLKNVDVKSFQDDQAMEPVYDFAQNHSKKKTLSPKAHKKLRGLLRKQNLIQEIVPVESLPAIWQKDRQGEA